MKKQLIIIGIVTLLLFVGLSGCESTPPNLIKKKAWRNHVFGDTVDKMNYSDDGDWFTFEIPSGIEKWRVTWSCITDGKSSFTIYEGFHDSNYVFDSIENITQGYKEYEYGKIWNTNYTIKINEVGGCDFYIDIYDFIELHPDP